MAAEVLEQGLQTLDRAALDQEARAGLGEALAIAYYKAIVLLQHQSALMKAVTELLLRYRFLLAAGIGGSTQSGFLAAAWPGS